MRAGKIRWDKLERKGGSKKEKLKSRTDIVSKKTWDSWSKDYLKGARPIIKTYKTEHEWKFYQNRLNGR